MAPGNGAYVVHKTPAGITGRSSNRPAKIVSSFAPIKTILSSLYQFLTSFLNFYIITGNNLTTLMMIQNTAGQDRILSAEDRRTYDDQKDAQPLAAAHPLTKEDNGKQRGKKRACSCQGDDKGSGGIRQGKVHESPCNGQ